MTVSYTDYIRVCLYQPKKQGTPQLPVGIWLAAPFVAGDASGGNVVINITCQTAQGKQYCWSWEEGTLSVSAAVVITGVPVTFTYTTGDTWANAAGVTGYLTLKKQSIVGSPPVTANIFAASGVPWQPLFSYITQANADSGLPIFTAHYDNNPNGVNVQLNAWGYVWDGEAARQAGGAIRP